jgi:hypothetical protein
MKTFTVTVRDSLGFTVRLHVEAKSLADNANDIQHVLGRTFQDLGCSIMNAELYSEVPY